MDFVELCRKLIALDSTPDQGNLEAARFLAELASQRGLSVELQEEVQGDIPQANVMIRAGVTRPAQELMFQTRLDTPDPGPFALWGKTGQNPFDAHIVEGAIWGLGTADCKLDAICKLEAFTRFIQSNPGTKGSLPPVLVYTFGEETGMAGALRLIRKNKVSARYAFIGEPSNLRILTAGNGFAHVNIWVPFETDEIHYRSSHDLRESSSTISKSFSGKAAHSATPELGESAIVKMLSYLGQLPSDLAVMNIDGGVNTNTVPAQAFIEIDTQSGFQKSMASKLNHIFAAVRRLEEEFFLYRDLDFSPPYPTLNLGSIRTRESGVEINGTVRIPPNITNEIYEQWMHKFKLDCQAVSAEFRVSDYKRPYRTDPQSSFVQMTKNVAQQLGLSAESGTHSSTNEASLFQRTGVECLSFGPGVREGNIHTPSEHVSLSDLRSAADFYATIMQRMCL